MELNNELALSLIDYGAMIIGHTGSYFVLQIIAIGLIFATPYLLIRHFLNPELLDICLKFPTYCPEVLFPRFISCTANPGGTGGGTDSVSTLCTNNYFDYQLLALLIGLTFFFIGWFLGGLRLLTLIVLFLDRCNNHLIRRWVKI